MKASSPRIRGFSLIELMVVVFIISIIAVFAVPATTTILRGSQLNQASQILADQISLARQYAISKNHPVEVRLIRYADPEVPGEYSPTGGTPASGNYRAIQILETLDVIDPSTNPPDFMRVPLDKPQLFPQAIVMNQDNPSTIIKEATTTAISPVVSDPPGASSRANDPPLPKSVKPQSGGQPQPVSYDYIYFRFMPDGSTNLPVSGSPPGDNANGAWCITLQNINDPQKGPTPPANFFTIQIDPISGTIKQYRPGI